MNNQVLEEWETEPNELQFTHKGLKCLILRINWSGHLCGYVGVEKLPEDFDEYNIKVHGGVTFNYELEGCNDEMKSYFKGCKHVIGFDVAHSMDLLPKNNYAISEILNGTYKNMEYMKEETIRLAEQLL